MDRRFSRYESWRDIPVQMLREFIDELRLRFTDRGVAKMADLSPTAVQDFVRARTQPERRTIRAFGELYLRLVPLPYEKETVGKKSRLPPLKSILPEGEQAALEAIDQRVGDEALREWLRFLVEAEYQLEEPHAEHRRQRKPRGTGPPRPSRSRKKPPAPESE